MTVSKQQRSWTVDITDTERYVARGYPWAAWDLLREVAPVYYYERPGYPPFWAVTRYEDVRTVHSHRRSSSTAGRSCGSTRYDGLAAMERFKQRQAERFGWDPEAPLDMVFLDRSEHLDLRMLTMRRFTPAAMRRLEPIWPTWRRAASPSSWSRPGPPAARRSTSWPTSRWPCPSPRSAG